ncbi:MAG TPA: DUF4349 domain-containing protein [Chthoniobacteraceae bacterium]|nr:DUF4349 domain-containing protein [Chthoniobacteraceae bacterium]
MNTPPPEITDPLLKSLVEETAGLPRMAALEARKARERKTRIPRAAGYSPFRPLPAIVWLLQFRATQAALALLLLAAMVAGGSLITGERSPLARKRGVDLLSAPTVTTKSGNQATVAVADANTNTYLGSQFGLNSLDFDTRADSGSTGVTANVYQTFAGNTPAQTLADNAPGTFWSPYTDETKTESDGRQAWISQPGLLHTDTGSSYKVADASFTFSGATVTSPVVDEKGQTSVVDNGIADIELKSDSGSPASTAVTVSGGSGVGQATSALGRTYTGPQLNVNSIIGGTSGFTTLGTGNVALSRDNIYTGTTSIRGGVLAVTNNTGLGFGATSLATSNGQHSMTVGGANGSGTYAGTLAEANQKSERLALQEREHGDDQNDGFPNLEKFKTQTALGDVKAMQYAQNNPTQPAPAPGKPGAPAATPAPVIDTRKLIRNAALDFEVASFEKALDTITQVAGEEQGYVFSQSSAKGANGKLQGQVVVKVLPPNLDRFLLKLRLLGDMKNQTVSAVDVSKDYFDTEARIRNSQVTEERLVDMMKTRTGKVSDLLDVEKEIARVRGEIEQMQGTLKVYDAQVQYATVTISLQEKDINQAAAYLLTQQAQLSVFSKDVEKAYEDARTEAADAKAQTLDSHIERDAAGHVVATIHLLIPPENSDTTIAKLKEIGRIDHFTSQTQRVVKDPSGNTATSDTAKVDRDKVELTMTIQHDAENAVQGTNIAIQTDHVEDKTNEIKKDAAEQGIEVKGAQFNRMRNGMEVSAMLLRMPMSKYSAFIEQVKALGKVKDFTVARREDATPNDDAPAEIVLQIFSQGSIVAPDTGLWATVRHTLGEGTAALMWSVRMIGVSLAFVAPWAVAGGLTLWLVMRRRRKARKQG